MWKVLLILSLTLITVISQSESKYGKYSENSKNESAKPKSKGTGITAWGIVFIVVAVILCGVAVYYIVIFYPILCKEERSYDRIELAAI